MNLGFGYGRGVPENVHTAWGARLIVTQDGTTDLLPNRQDLVEKDENTRADLIAWLNDGGIANVRKWIERLLAEYVMDTRKSEEFRATFVGGARAVANTNGSAGYCYVAVWLDKHDDAPGFKRTYHAVELDGDRHVGPGLWLDVIHEANGLAGAEGIEGGIFGAPRHADDAPGVEIYDDADVSHDLPLGDKDRDEWLRDPRNTVTITSKTPLGERLLRKANLIVEGATSG